MNQNHEPKTARQAAYLQRLTEAHDRTLKAIEGLDPNECVMGDWTVKDILGHMVSWNEEFRLNIELILQGKYPGYDHQISGEDNFASWNQDQINQKRSWTFERICEDFELDYQQAIQLILRLSPEQFRMTGLAAWNPAALEGSSELGEDDLDSVNSLLTFHWRHMNQHAREIEQWRVSSGK